MQKSGGRLTGTAALVLILTLLGGCALNDLQQSPPVSAASDCAESRAGLDAQLHERPNNVVVLNRRAATYVCDEQYSAAVADLSRAIQLQPTASEFEQRAAIYAREHNLKDAFADLDDASRIEPENPMPYLQKGETL
jgi:cytochrome c-type biogenesis protein CcmH/NrfG